MTPQQIDAMKLALGQLQAGFVGNAMQILREALAEHAMQEVQRVGQEIEQEPGTLHIDRLNQWLDASLKAKAAQPKQEPVGQLLEVAFGRGQVMWFNKPKDESMLYTTPPQRTWVGLTEKEHTEIAIECGCMSAEWVFYGAAVERKLKEHNT